MLGDSILAWAGVYAIQRGTPHLQLPSPHSVGWYGIRGMPWTQFTHSLQLRILFQAPPKVIMIHLGGNDLTHTGILPIFNLIRRGINYISRACPDAHFIWVDILQRLHWTDSYRGDVRIERKRQRVNRFGRNLITSLPKGHFLVHDIDIYTPGFFRNDGTHLSRVGLAMYLDAARESILPLLQG